MSEGTFDLAGSASGEMIRQGFHVGFPDGVAAQIASIRASGQAPVSPGQTDLRNLLWSSIDNDTSRDLDQVEVAERVDGGIRIRVGIADVAASVPKGSPIDQHAADQTQTVYTAVRNFPMLPNELSTDLTSLNEDVDRATVVTEFVVDAQGRLSGQAISAAVLRNRAQLAYSRVGPWLEDKGEADARVDAYAELQAQLKLQDEAAQAMRAFRVSEGALEFQRVEADPVVIDGSVRAIHEAPHNRATQLIEDFMIGANETMAQTLKSVGRSCIRRVVRTPARWDRIVALAKDRGADLPVAADSAALNAFLRAQRVADLVHYPDLSLAVIKLMGAGEYVLTTGGDRDAPGHFGLAARDYAHSTAPNRRFADLVVQRLVKAMLAGQNAPYTDDELAAIATQCNKQEKAARKVERAMEKRVAAVAMSHSIGRQFRGVVTGASDKGTYVRVFDPPVEGKIVRGEEGLDIGDTIEVTLLHTDPVHAFIDFGRG